MDPSYRDILPRFHLAAMGVLVAAMTCTACGDDVVSIGEGSGSSSTSAGGMDDTTGLDSTGGTQGSTGGGSTDTGGPPEVPEPPTNPLCDGTTALAQGPFLSATPVDISVALPADDDNGGDSICPELPDIAGDALLVRIYRPATNSAGAWPTGPFPLVVHAHGQGQQHIYYEDLGNRLAEEGYVFLSISHGIGNPTASEVDDLHACALSWIGSSDPSTGGAPIFSPGGSPRLSCDLTIMGHSQGANAGRDFVFNRETEFWSPYWFDFEAAAYIGFDPSTNGAVEAPLDLLVPTLIFGAGYEDDAGAAVAAYDDTPPEETRPESTPPRILIHVHAATHDGFGGTVVTSTAGLNSTLEYVPRFLEWNVEGQNVADNRRVLHTEEFPESLREPTSHTMANSYGNLGWEDCSQFGSAMLCDSIVGCAWDTGIFPPACVDLDCTDPDHADPMDCEAREGCLEYMGGCVARPAIYSAFTIDTRSSSDFVERVEYFPPGGSDGTLSGSLITSGQASTGDILVDFMSLFPAAIGSSHETSAMLTSWGPGEASSTGTVSIVPSALDPDRIPHATHLSFRVANVPESCSPRDEPLTIGVRLRNDPSQNLPYFQPPVVPMQRIHPPFGVICSETTMTTVRIPMREFCVGEDLDTSAINEIELYYPDHGFDRHAIVDSFEFTRHADDVVDPDTGQSNHCPIFSGVYACPATGTLTVEESTCDVEPVGNECPSSDITVTNLSAPAADDGRGGFNGWRIHAHPGVIDNPASLTASEQAWLEERCVQACENQWDDVPSIEANCSAAGALGAPYLVTTPSIGSRAIIPAVNQDGGGLLGMQTLSCSLHDDCCQEFDEIATCPAVPSRVTPARDPLGDGQEWELSLTGIMSADSEQATSSATADLTGAIGYSFCRDGNQVNCPFYLGSLHLELAGPLEITLACSGSMENHEIEDLGIDLVQPSMGIAEAGTSLKAFAPQSLNIEATGTVDGLPVSLRGVIEVPTLLGAGPGWALLQSGGQPFITIDVPCGTEMVPVDLWWDFEDDATTASPPSVTVDLPESVSCPDTIRLELADASDPDLDLAGVDWYVDGIKLTSSVEELDFTEDHEITAVARDSRGAADSDTVTIKCD